MSNIASITEASVKKKAKSSKPLKAAKNKPASSNVSENDREQALNAVTKIMETVPGLESNVAPLRAVPPPQARERKSAFYPSGLTIKFTGAPNPVRGGTNRAEIWSLFKNGMTVGEFTTALDTTDKRSRDGKTLKGGHGDLKIAVEKGYIELI